VRSNLHPQHFGISRKLEAKENLMKLVLLVLATLLNCSCLSTIVLHGIKTQNKNSYYPVAKMTQIKGGVTAKGDFVLYQLIAAKNTTYMVNGKRFTQAIIKRNSAGDFMISDEIDQGTIRPIAVYTQAETPKENEEYLKIHEHKRGFIKMEYRNQDNDLCLFDVQNTYSRDPNLMKRTGFALLFPVALSADLGLTVITMGAWSESGKAAKRFLCSF
jgi:hypothetical protein